MTVTLSQCQADLPRLVELASQGEDVLITVDGKVKARLTQVAPAPTACLEKLDQQSGTDLQIERPEDILSRLREKRE